MDPPKNGIPFSAALVTFIFVVISFVALLFVSFANTTIPQACKTLKGIDHECACMSYKGRVGWIQWSHIASGFLALPFLYFAIRLWSGPKNDYVTQGSVLWLLLCLILVWSIGLYLTENYVYNQCETYSQKGQYTETTAKYIHRTNLATMVTIVTIIVCIIIVNVVEHFKSKSKDSLFGSNFGSNFTSSSGSSSSGSSSSAGSEQSFDKPRRNAIAYDFSGGARLDWFWRD